MLETCLWHDGHALIMSGRRWIFPSSAFARCLVNIVQHNASDLTGERMKSGCQSTSSSWRASTVAMDTAGLLSYSDGPAGTSMTNVPLGGALLACRAKVERIWRRERLKVPSMQPKRKRLWSNDGSCIRLRGERLNHVWSYDFMEDRTHDGRKIRMLNVVDEYTRECLAIRVDRRLNGTSVIDVLTDLFILRGVPGHIRSDHGPEFIAKAVQVWIHAVGAKTAYITPGSPWKNGYIESFNARVRDELLNGELF